MCSLGEDLSFKQSRGHTLPPAEDLKAAPPIRQPTSTAAATTTTTTASPHEAASSPPLPENPTRRRSSFEFRREELPMYETIGEYLVVQKIGGDNSKVKLGMHKITTEKVAIKNLSKVLMSEEERDRARREIAIMKKLTGLNNPHIVKLKDSIETEDSFIIIMEYVKGGELVGTILRSRDLSEQKVHRWFKQILYAIETCHRNNVVHRDIKLQNILLDENENVKLIDFGLSNYVQNGVLRSTFCGTPAYASPEILLGNKYEGPEVDVWSLGVVLYSMLTANFPFTTVGDILAGKFEEPTYISPACLALLKKMLCVDTDKRVTLSGIIADSWIQHGPGASHTQSFPITYENTSLELERQEREAQKRQQAEQQQQHHHHHQQPQQQQQQYHHHQQPQNHQRNYQQPQHLEQQYQQHQQQQTRPIQQQQEPQHLEQQLQQQQQQQQFQYHLQHHQQQQQPQQSKQEEYSTLTQPPSPMALPLMNFSPNTEPTPTDEALHIIEYDLEPAYKKMRGL